MLASIRDVREARVALDNGADIIDLKDPARGALGELTLSAITEILGEVNGRRRISATIGDVPFRSDRLRPRIEAMAATGVDFVKVGVFGDAANIEVLEMLRELSLKGPRIVLVFFAEDAFHESSFGLFVRHGVSGVMLDTRSKDSGPLRSKLSDSRLQSFVSRAGEANLMCGLAGSLGMEDIPALLAMRPDYLGFRGALCRGSNRTQVMDAEAVRTIRYALFRPAQSDRAELRTTM